VSFANYFATQQKKTLLFVSFGLLLLQLFIFVLWTFTAAAEGKIPWQASGRKAEERAESVSDNRRHQRCAMPEVRNRRDERHSGNESKAKAKA